MNKKGTGFILLAVGILFILGIRLNLMHRELVGCNGDETTMMDNDALPEGIGSAEDMQARMNFELKRLADPQTGKVPDNMRARELAFMSGTYKNNGAGAVSFDRNGPYNIGGRTRAFALDVDDENILLAGGVTGAMWRSTDAGHSFTQTTTPAQLHSITTIAQDVRPGKHNVWYYGTGEQYAVVSPAPVQASGNGIYKSTDGGKSWNVLPSTVSPGLNATYNNTGFNYVWKVIADPTDLTHDVVYAAVINGIYKSIDGGATWKAILGLDTSASVAASEYTDLVMTPSGILYAHINGHNSYSGVWRSADKGDTWTSITPNGWPGSTGRVVMAVYPQDETKLMMIAYTPGSSGKNNHNLWHYEYLSGNGSGGSGGRWTNRSANLPDFVCQLFFKFKFGIYSSQYGYDMCLAISPADSNIVFLGGTNIYRSNDGFTTNTGYSWIGGYQCNIDQPSNYVYPNHHPDQHSLFFSPNDPDILYSSNDGGIYKTLDNTKDSIEWIPLNNGYMNAQFYAVALETGNSSSNKMAGGMQDNGSWMTNTRDASSPWKNVLYGDGGFCAIPKGKNYMVAEWEQGRVLICEQDNNGNYTRHTRIDPIGGSNYLFIPPFMLDPVNDRRLYLAAGSVIYVQNNLDAIPLTGNEYDSISTGWSPIDATNIGGSITSAGITCFSKSAADSNKLYFGAGNGAIYRVDNLLGNAERVVINDSTMPAAYPNCIWVNPKNAAELIVTFSNYGVKSIFHSTNSGTSWQDISGNLEQNPDGSGDGPAVFWLDVLTLPDSTIYFAATTTGLYSTTRLNGTGTIWKQEGANTIGNAVVDMVVTRDYDGMVMVGTHGCGIFTARYKNVEGINDAPTTDLSVTVSPNPFSNMSTFHFTTNEVIATTINIYDVTGKKVASLKDNNQTPGPHTMQWNGGNLDNGLYLYELQAGKHHASGKLILSR